MTRFFNSAKKNYKTFKNNHLRLVTLVWCLGALSPSCRIVYDEGFIMVYLIAPSTLISSFRMDTPLKIDTIYKYKLDYVK